MYVADGSVIPTSLGVNPLLTISALAERTVKLLADERGWVIDYTSATPKLPARPDRVVGIQFTERMSGSVATGATIPDDYRAAADLGEASGNAISFVFTIIAEDLRAFLANPAHTARMIGTVTIPALSAQPMMASNGVFNLLVCDPDSVDAPQHELPGEPDRSRRAAVFPQGAQEHPRRAWFRYMVGHHHVVRRHPRRSR